MPAAQSSNEVLPSPEQRLRQGGIACYAWPLVALVRLHPPPAPLTRLRQTVLRAVVIAVVCPHGVILRLLLQ